MFLKDGSKHIDLHPILINGFEEPPPHAPMSKIRPSLISFKRFAISAISSRLAEFFRSKVFFIE